jgi:Protein of unknown function (DUF2975)
MNDKEPVMAKAMFSQVDDILTRLLLMALAAVTAVLAVGVPVAEWLRGEPLRWEATTASSGALPTSLASPGGGARLTWNGDSQVSLDHAGTGLWLLTLLPGLLLSLVVVIVVIQLLRVMSRLHRGIPFASASVGALRWIAVALLAGTGAVKITGSLANAAVVHRALPSSPISFTILSGGQVVLVVSGLVAAMLAAAFAQGQRLAAEVEGLV